MVMIATTSTTDRIEQNGVNRFLRQFSISRSLLVDFRGVETRIGPSKLAFERDHEMRNLGQPAKVASNGSAEWMVNYQAGEVCSLG